MSKKETTNPKEVRNQNYEAKKMNNSENLKKKKDKDLPWWVELLFVQIGLPDKLLIKILKAKKNSKEFIKNDKKLVIIFLFLISLLAIYLVILFEQIITLPTMGGFYLSFSLSFRSYSFSWLHNFGFYPL